jgi:transcriptional regulator with XRE-family HTH domain
MSSSRGDRPPAERLEALGDVGALSPIGCRTGRAVLKWGVRDLADAAGVTPDTISQYERGRPMRTSNKIKVVRALASHGVQLLLRGGAGARLVGPGA